MMMTENWARKFHLNNVFGRPVILVLTVLKKAINFLTILVS